MVNVFENISKNEFEFIVKFGKRSNSLFGVELPSIIYFPYRFTKIDLPELMQEGNIEEIINIICKEKEIEIKEITQRETISFVLWLKDEIEAIHQLESRYLQSQPDPDMIAAGVNDLNEFGELNVIDSLAGGDILKWDEVGRIPYYKVFDKLRKNIIDRRINTNYQKILATKNKHR